MANNKQQAITNPVYYANTETNRYIVLSAKDGNRDIHHIYDKRDMQLLFERSGDLFRVLYELGEPLFVRARAQK